MSIAGLIIGIVAGIGFLVPFIYPFLVWLNLLNASLAILGLIISLTGIIKGTNRVLGLVGILICGIICILSLIKLV